MTSEQGSYPTCPEGSTLRSAWIEFPLRGMDGDLRTHVAGATADISCGRNVRELIKLLYRTAIDEAHHDRSTDVPSRKLCVYNSYTLEPPEADSVSAIGAV